MLGVCGGAVALAVVVGALVSSDRGARVVPPPARPPAPLEPVRPALAAPPAPQPDPPPPPQADPPIEVSSAQLGKDYDANEVSADDRYRGRTLRVTGIVYAVRKDFRDRPILELATSNQFVHVHAHFDSPASLAKLLRGDKAVVLCVGAAALMGPVLEGCVIERLFRRAPE